MGCFFYSNFEGKDLIAQVRANGEGEFYQKIEFNIDYLKEDAVQSDFGLESDVLNKEIELNKYNLAVNNLENEIRDLTKDYPIEIMADEIAHFDSKVAALIVGIAKKESNWGIHSPSKNGQTCYNYWGYKGAGSRGAALGYSCFGSPEEAIEIVGGRINHLATQNIDTPQKMLVWKCGSSCAGHDPAGVRKWVSDVTIYYNKINKIAS
ncbi:MAG: hypothetical protein WAV16_01790 [Candidatus Moraniibacteriota bacterium]